MISDPIMSAILLAAKEGRDISEYIDRELLRIIQEGSGAMGESAEEWIKRLAAELESKDFFD